MHILLLLIFAVAVYLVWRKSPSRAVLVLVSATAGSIVVGVLVFTLLGLLISADSGDEAWEPPDIHGGAIGWVSLNANYSVFDEDGGGGTYGNPKLLRVAVQTDTRSEDDFRTITSEVAGQAREADFIWVHFFEDTVGNPTGSSIKIQTEEGAEFMNSLWDKYKNDPYFAEDGGKFEDGVFMYDSESEVQKYTEGWGPTLERRVSRVTEVK